MVEITCWNLGILNSNGWNVELVMCWWWICIQFDENTWTSHGTCHDRILYVYVCMCFICIWMMDDMLTWCTCEIGCESMYVCMWNPWPNVYICMDDMCNMMCMWYWMMYACMHVCHAWPNLDGCMYAMCLCIMHVKLDVKCMNTCMPCYGLINVQVCCM